MLYSTLLTVSSSPRRLRIVSVTNSTGVQPPEEPIVYIQYTTREITTYSTEYSRSNKVLVAINFYSMGVPRPSLGMRFVRSNPIV